jgi:transcriptional regulator with XRE-family HTH domain
VAVRAESHVGIRLRELRVERGLSLSAVAAATGLSASSLSMTENGKSDITFGRLQQLIDFYGVTLSELVPEPPPVEPVVVRAGERRALLSPSEGIELHLLTHGGPHALQPVFVTYQPGGELVDYELESAREVFWLVLEGELEVTIAGHEPVWLGPGDSILIEEPGRLGVRNPGDVPASFVAIGMTADTPGRGGG